MKHHLSIFLILVISFTGCQVARELHYIKEADNYYRIKIKECAFLSSSRYMSGYFDSQAVDTYFGEISRPESSDLNNQTVQIITNSGDKTAASSVELLGNRKLVLILSTNGDFVSNQISSFAENEQVLEYMVRYVNKDQIQLNARLNNNLETKKKNYEAILKMGDQFILSVNIDSLNIDYTREQLLAFLNCLAIYKDENIRLYTFDEAENWFNIKF